VGARLAGLAALLVVLGVPLGPAVAGDPSLDEAGSLVRTAQTLAKDAEVLATLQKTQAVLEVAAKSPDRGPDAIHSAQAARDLLQALTQDPRWLGKKHRAYAVKALARVQAYLVGPPVDSGKARGSPEVVTVLPGSIRRLLPSTGASPSTRFVLPPGDAPRPGAYVDAAEMVPSPWYQVDSGCGHTSGIRVLGRIHTTGPVEDAFVRFRTDLNEWGGSEHHVRCPAAGWWAGIEEEFVRTFPWIEHVHLEVVSPTAGPRVESEPVEIHGTCTPHPTQPSAQDAGPRSTTEPQRRGVLTAFTPALHGFRFENTFANNAGVEVRTSGLCGGMVYAALDYFHAHRPIPTQDYRPSTGTLLQNYVYGRQVTSIGLNLTQFARMAANAAVDPRGAFLWGLSRGGGLGAARYELDRGRPVPLCLRALPGGISADHQVLAIGYDMGRYVPDSPAFREDLRIYVYDPNCRMQIRALRPDLAQGCYVYEDLPGYPNAQWVCYFVDQSYVRDPLVPEIREPDLGPNDELVRELLVTFVTGDHHLSGVYDNVRATVYVRGRPPVSFENLNHSQVWIIRYDETVSLPLPAPVRLADIERVEFQKALGERWDVSSVSLRARGGGRDRRSEHPGTGGAPLVTLEGASRRFSITPAWRSP
jgi:hypothetical protein